MPISLLLALPLRIFRLSYGPAQALTLISFPSFRPFVVHLPVLGFFCDVVDTKFRHYIHLCIFKFFVLMRAAAAVSWNLEPRASSFLPVYRHIIVPRQVEIQTLNQSQQSLFVGFVSESRFLSLVERFVEGRTVVRWYNCVTTGLYRWSGHQSEDGPAKRPREQQFFKVLKSLCFE